MWRLFSDLHLVEIGSIIGRSLMKINGETHQDTPGTLGIGDTGLKKKNMKMNTSVRVQNQI